MALRAGSEREGSDKHHTEQTDSSPVLGPGSDPTQLIACEAGDQRMWPQAGRDIRAREAWRRGLRVSRATGTLFWGQK